MAIDLQSYDEGLAHCRLQATMALNSGRVQHTPVRTGRVRIYPDCRLVRGHIALVINGGKPVKETRQVNAARVANHQPFVAYRAAIGSTEESPFSVTRKFCT